ncbi:MAG: acetylglutamate kinase [Rhizobiales bacterium TMED143]|nr:acetylglutamate kinase [Rhodobiaceae bacterium]MBL6786437.1 acetylglutamate kinase [PS1 clade bacterium]OUV92900.1 MAG: acetylglutamate kinase [Rhizobiales bacterium TMED143]CAI8297650.1 MAG: Acetylglutamate kinase [Rhodobiaceae bacterium UBA7378]|tara:strand:+ start:1886 stop:2800 length:915 start_codon:yes stop_codon:yes gene_type:complete
MSSKSKIRKPASSDDWIAQAHVLTEALPFMQRYDRKTVVIKYGGHAMGDAVLSSQFAQDVVLLKQSGINPVIVHGGGPQIASMLERLNIKSRFANGLRVTDAETIEVVEMVLAGAINKQIVTALNQAGGRAVGLSGKDGDLMIASKTRTRKRDAQSNVEKAVNLGFVGTPKKVNTDVLDVMLRSDIIPVLAPIATSDKGQTLNVNADTAAGALAAALKAERLLMLTDVQGVLDAKGKLVSRLTQRRAATLIRSGTAKGGMIPKIETALAAVKNGVGATVILDGRVPHAILLELFTELGAGTLIE